MRWRIYMTARLIGAIGRRYRQTVVVEADTPADAREKAYDTHEHITFHSINSLEELAKDYVKGE